MTKDEQFLIKLYEMAGKQGNIYKAINCLDIGRAIGQNDRGASVIARNLAQANFVKKADADAIFLTDHGLRLVDVLLKPKK